MHTEESGAASGWRTGMRRWSGLALFAATLSLLATGCLTTDAHVTIDDDGSGELRMEVFPPPEVSGSLDATGVEALARDSLEGVGGATFETRERTGQAFYTVKVPFEDFRQLNTNIADGATVAGQSLTPFSQLDLRELPDGGWSLNAVTNPLEQAATFSEGSPLAGLKGLAASEEAGVGLELSVTLPGRLTDSNADVQDGDTARWILADPAATYTLAMQTEATPLLTPFQWALIGLVAVFVIGGLFVFLGAARGLKCRMLRKPSRKRVVTAVSSGWENPGAATDPGPPAPVDPSTGESDPQPPQTLPPLNPQSPPPPGAEEPSSGEILRPPTVLPPGPELSSDEPGSER